MELSEKILLILPKNKYFDPSKKGGSNEGQSFFMKNQQELIQVFNIIFDSDLVMKDLFHKRLWYVSDMFYGDFNYNI